MAARKSGLASPTSNLRLSRRLISSQTRLAPEVPAWRVYRRLFVVRVITKRYRGDTVEVCARPGQGAEPTRLE